MSTIVSQWLAAYRWRLEQVQRDYPTFPRQHKVNLAKGSAHLKVPEGQECLMTRAKVSIRKPGEGEKAPEADPYTLSLANAIVQGMGRINLEVLGPKVKRAHTAAPLPEPVQAEDRAETEAGVPASPERTPNHRLTRAEMAHWDDVYGSWAEENDQMPGDKALTHFTGVPVSTWSTVRTHLGERGFKFEMTGSKRTRAFKVVARPQKAPPAPTTLHIPANGTVDPAEWEMFKQFQAWAKAVKGGK